MNFVCIMMNSQRCWLLPSATKLGQGYIFTGICHSVNRGVSAPGGVCSQGGVCYRGGWWGCLLLWGLFPGWGGVWSRGRGCVGSGGPGGYPPTRPLLRVVRILLEFILIQMCCSVVKYCKTADLIIYE